MEKEKEKEGLNKSQLGQTRFPTSPTSENISISPGTSPQIDSSNEEGKHVIEESKIKISSEERNKKTKLGGLFSRWKKGRNDRSVDQTREASHKEEEQKETVSVIEQSGRDYEKKVKEEVKEDDDSNRSKPGGQQENKKRDDNEHKDKDDGDVVYLSNEDIEDMLK
jgi:hypothetical protein